VRHVDAGRHLEEFGDDMGQAPAARRRNMESAADMAASAKKKAAGGAEWGAALQFGAGAATFVSKAWPALALLA
jgi:hypothetical protein